MHLFACWTYQLLHVPTCISSSLQPLSCRHTFPLAKSTYTICVLHAQAASVYQKGLDETDRQGTVCSRRFFVIKGVFALQQLPWGKHRTCVVTSSFVLICLHSATTALPYTSWYPLGTLSHGEPAVSRDYKSSGGVCARVWGLAGTCSPRVMNDDAPLSKTLLVTCGVSIGTSSTAAMHPDEQVLHLHTPFCAVS